MSLLVVGSVGLDTVQTPFGQVEGVLGGAAVYFSLAASTFCPVQMVGVVGGDFPDEHRELLRGRGVDLGGLQVERSGRTFRWKGRYDYDLNVAHTLETELNVFADFSPALPDHYRSASLLYLANIQPGLQRGVLEQVERPRFVGVDSMNFWIENPATRAELAAVIRQVDGVFMNSAELREYTRRATLLDGARALLDEGPRVVLIKSGEHGAMAVSREGVFVAPAYPLEQVVDPTGAGDSFAGGFFGALSQAPEVDWPAIKRALAIGSVVASFTVEAFSVERLRTLERAAVQNRLRELRELTTFEIELAGDAEAAMAQRAGAETSPPSSR